MTRALLFLAALLLACPALGAADQNSSPGTKDNPVVVDPLDLRQPVPDPEAELTQKYDAKTVRFTGVLRSWGTEASKQKWYDFQTDVPQVGNTARGTKQAKAKTDRVIVRVYFQRPDQLLRPQQTRLPLTVEGIGEIRVDGSLVIRNATIVTTVAGSKR
jgi:hypothetical protein